MGFFGSGKKEENVIQQDLSKKEQPGSVFLMHLFMRDACKMPEKEFMTEVMRKHLGDVDCFCHDGKAAGFAPMKYKVEFKDGSMPPQLMIMDCIKTDNFHIDEITRSQMWDCPESEELLSACKYHVVATDMLAGAMEYKDRADMLMDYMEALVEMYPTCEAVFFQNSGKLFTRDKIVNHQIPAKKNSETLKIRIFRMITEHPIFISLVKVIISRRLKYYWNRELIRILMITGDIRQS